MPKKKTTEEPSFEAVMDKLEVLVDKLESGEAGLEEALSIYAEGVGLVGTARQKIEAVEKRINELDVNKKADSEMILFDTGENSNE